MQCALMDDHACRGCDRYSCHYRYPKDEGCLKYLFALSLVCEVELVVFGYVCVVLVNLELSVFKTV